MLQGSQRGNGTVNQATKKGGSCRLFNLLHVTERFGYFCRAAGVVQRQLYVGLECLAAAITAAGALCFALQLKIDAYLRLLVTSYVLMALLLALANALPENCRALAQTGKMSYQIMLLDPFYKVVLFAAAGKLFGGMPLALLPLIAAADFALGVITCMVIRKIPGVRILFGL